MTTRSSAARGYGAAWQRARIGYLRSHPLCVMCQQLGKLELAAVVDHVEPHRLGQAIESGEPGQIAAARRRFWDRSNWQALCKHCHDSGKQASEKSGWIRGADADGVPIDPGHHWRQA